MGRRLLTLAGLAALLVLGVVPIHAGPLVYNITFLFSAGSSAPPALPTGSFDYDASAAVGSQFSNFIVNWDGMSFNLTSAANNPQVDNTPASPCISGDNSAGVFNALINPGNCAYVGWTATASQPLPYVIGTFDIELFSSQTPANNGLEVGECCLVSRSGSTPVSAAIGSFAVTQAPEPATISTLMIGVLTIFGVKAGQTIRRRRYNS